MPFYRKRPIMIEAHRLAESMSVTTLEGMTTGDAGDWLITAAKGEQYFCKDDIFRVLYEHTDTLSLEMLDAT